VRILITGATGFKGAWLALWLIERGHEVWGYSLAPRRGIKGELGIFESAEVAQAMIQSSGEDLKGDIRDPEKIRKVAKDIRPDAVVHLAAQALVRESFRDPRFTYETNVLGTYNVVEAAQQCGAKGLLIVTSDKVYANFGDEYSQKGYSETDALGISPLHADPYSTSKAAADIIAQTEIRRWDGAAAAIARGGNVIGGGDVAQDRLMVDLVRALTRGQGLDSVELRNPNATRPWQHVLDCLAGYIKILDCLLSPDPAEVELVRGQAFNVGPNSADSPEVSVGEVAQTAEHAAEKLRVQWGLPPETPTQNSQNPSPVSAPDLPNIVPEAKALSLNSDKVRSILGYRPQFSVAQSVELTLDWEFRVRIGQNPRSVTLDQIQRYEQLDPSSFHPSD
jgi:CDP-glucose 4,6-dehydratase